MMDRLAAGIPLGGSGFLNRGKLGSIRMRQGERTRGMMGEGERAMGDVTLGTEIWGLISGGSATEVMAATFFSPLELTSLSRD